MYLTVRRNAHTFSKSQNTAVGNYFQLRKDELSLVPRVEIPLEEAPSLLGAPSIWACFFSAAYIDRVLHVFSLVAFEEIGTWPKYVLALGIDITFKSNFKLCEQGGDLTSLKKNGDSVSFYLIRVYAHRQ